MEVKKVDTKELELPDTVYVRDIENRVFQEIVLECLTKIPGISAVEGNILDNFLGRSEGIKGVQAEQDLKNHSISLKVEVNIAYGMSIPEKAEEIQNLIAEEITKLTGLHVASVHVIFKALIQPQDPNKKEQLERAKKEQKLHSSTTEYSDIF